MVTTINFRISEDLKDELKLIADENDMKISSLVRDIVSEYIDDYHYYKTAEIPVVYLESCIDNNL